MAIGSRFSSVNPRRGVASPQVGVPSGRGSTTSTTTTTTNVASSRMSRSLPPTAGMQNRREAGSPNTTGRSGQLPPRVISPMGGRVTPPPRSGEVTRDSSSGMAQRTSGSVNPPRAGMARPTSPSTAQRTSGSVNSPRAGVTRPTSPSMAQRTSGSVNPPRAVMARPPSPSMTQRTSVGANPPRGVVARGSLPIVNNIRGTSRIMNETWEEKKARSKEERDKLSITNRFRMGELEDTPAFAGFAGGGSTGIDGSNAFGNGSDISFDLGGKKRRFSGFRLLKILFVVIIIIFAILFILFNRYKVYDRSLSAKDINSTEDANALISRINGEGQNAYASKEKRVSVITVKKIKISSSFDAFGKVALYNPLDLSFNEQGIIVYLKAVEGKWYKKGALLAKLDTKSANFDVQIKKHDYLGKKKQFVRTVNLYRKGATSKAYYDKVEASYEASKSAYFKATEHVKNMYIRAPFSGMVSKRYKEKSEQALEGEKVLRFYNPSLLQIDVVLTSKIAKAILSQGRNNFVYKVYSEDNPVKKYKVRLKEVSHVDNNKSVSSYLFKFTISKKVAKDLIAGASVKLDVVGKKAKNSLYIPMGSVLSDAEGRMYVWLVKDNVVLKKYVKTGEINNDRVEIVKGIQEGDVIVTAGMGSLFNKQKVSIIN